MYSTYSDKKASIVERVQKTIRGRLFKLFTANKNNKWLDALPKIIESYNNSVHSTIQMKPNDVKPEHTNTLLKRLYSNKKIGQKNVMSQKPYDHIWAYAPNFIDFGP